MSVPNQAFIIQDVWKMYQGFGRGLISGEKIKIKFSQEKNKKNLKILYK